MNVAQSAGTNQREEEKLQGICHRHHRTCREERGTKTGQGGTANKAKNSTKRMERELDKGIGQLGKGSTVNSAVRSIGKENRIRE